VRSVDRAAPSRASAAEDGPGWRVRTVPMHRVRAGDLVVVGSDGVRVEAPERPRGATPFEFMTSEVSSEKPKGLLVYDVSRRIRRAKAAGGRVLAVCGPAVIHTAAVDAGYIDGGVMYECVRRGVPFVLGGSVRDDGPLPDVYTDVVEAADAMRYLLQGVTVALMLASTLHAIATGNLLPSGVETYCVDINQAVVTKLADRGRHQALGIVTDVGR